MRGEHALKPSRIIAEGLAELRPDSGLLVIDGAGHMGPFTHASKVAALIVRHIATIDAQSWKAQSRVAAALMADLHHTAKTLGLNGPPALFGRADKVIE
jgi:hypothetical protein